MDFPREAIEPKAIASRGGGGGSVPEVLRKPIATCFFPWGVQNPCPPLPPLWIHTCHQPQPAWDLLISSLAPYNYVYTTGLPYTS